MSCGLGVGFFDWLGVAQVVMPLTLGFSSGHDLMAHEFEPCIKLCTDSVEPA